MTTHYDGNRELITGWTLNFNDLTEAPIPKMSPISRYSIPFPICL